MMSALNNIDSRPIRGEMKTWIVRNYLIPSMQFQLTANLTCKSTILKLENNISKLLKKWLRLPKNATRVLFHHPSAAIIGVPPLQHVKTSTKLSFICALMNTSDPTISEITHLIDDKDFINRVDIPAVAVSMLKEAKASISSTSSRQLKQTSRKCFPLD